MENCLVTKLKAVVQNDELLKIGECAMNVAITNAVTNAVITCSDGLSKLRMVDDGYYFTQHGQQVREVSADGSYFTLPAGTYRVVLSGKYAVNALVHVDAAFDISELKLMLSPFNNFTSSAYNLSGSINDIAASSFGAYAPNKGITGDLSKISVTKDLYLNGCNLTGNLADLLNRPIYANWISGAGSVYLYDLVNISGSIEDFVASIKAKGEVNGTLNLSLRGSNITFGDYNFKTASIILRGNSYLKWDTNTIVYQCGSDAEVANPATPVTIFAKGVSQSQIETWTNLNNVVYEIE